ncbi:MAG: DegV family protein [Bacilli bacterium]|nr:DegV family protein [Bacilli bacterium]
MIRIICDSASDITLKDAKKLNIDVVPMPIRFDDKEYLDGVNISFDEFYDKLAVEKNLPVTSQINPFVWEEKINQYPDDEIILITLSSRLSGTYKSALTASEGKKNVRVVDSLNATAGIRVLVDRAVDLREQGKTIDEICDVLNEEKKNICVIGVLDNLKALKKGGRISPTVAMVGGLLGIKPIIEVKDGEVVMAGKARGSHNGFKRVKEIILDYGGIDTTKEVILAYTGNSDEMLEKYIASAKNDVINRSFNIQRIGATIGTHIGDGAIAIVFSHNVKK